MGTNHTPGPWKSRPLKKSIEIFSTATNKKICSVPLAAFTENDQNHTNARLIAAAPELLAALQEFEIETCPRCDGAGYEAKPDEADACHRCAGAGEVIKAGWPAHVRSAIAKATQS